MAAATLPAPGTTVGPCAEPCAHVDCTATRKIAETCCAYCGEPIGYDTRFYRMNCGNMLDQVHVVTDYSHAACEEIRA